MKNKLSIPKDFWKDFKDRKDFDEFFSELFQEGINQMLKGEKGLIVNGYLIMEDYSLFVLMPMHLHVK